MTAIFYYLLGNLLQIVSFMLLSICKSSETWTWNYPSKFITFRAFKWFCFRMWALILSKVPPTTIFVVQFLLFLETILQVSILVGTLQVLFESVDTVWQTKVTICFCTKSLHMDVISLFFHTKNWWYSFYSLLIP